MGQGASRAADDDVFFESGVRVTQGLLEQLEGKPRAARAPPAAPTASSLAIRPREDVEAAARAAAQQDAALARALERSRRVGGMLLKAKDEELQRIGQLADELLAREFAAPQRPRPCQAEADACVRCYADNAADPLACGPSVEAYSACAKAAWQEALQRAV